MKGDVVLNCDRPQEQVIVLFRVLGAAEISKENIVQLSYKSFFTRKWYESLSDPVRCNNWIEMQRRMTDISAIPSKNNGELKRLGTVIREIKTELMKAERQIQGSKQYDQAETHKRMAFTLRHTVQRQHDEIVALKQKIGELEAMKIQHEEQLRQLQQVLEQAKRREGEDEVPDKAYLERMIEEVEEDRMENLPNLEDVSSDDEDDRMEEIHTLEDISSDEGDNRVVDRHDSPEDRTSLNRLRKDLWKMEKVLKRFPYRMFGDTKDIASD
uniref:Unconventional myosin-Va-like n=1 Tax=Haemonchus contortus TaxID=6289 RepID=A0A7I4YB64_HAECO